MRKRLAEDLVLYFSPLYPACFGAKRGRWALVGAGGNVGDVPRRFKKLSLSLRSHPRVRLAATAPLLKNPPFGYLEQPHFYNTLLLVRTTLSPQELLRFLLGRERRFGRRRTFKNAPRTLDLDIIFYENLRIRKKGLAIPHPKWRERLSVTIPLCYLDRP